MTKLVRLLAVAAVGLIAPLFAASAAWADAPKFHSVSSAIDESAALVVGFDERGLGNENIDYTLTADATALYACINWGGNHPQAANKETIHAQVSAGGSFEPKNGRVVASLSAAPPSAGDFACPPGQDLVLAAVSYAGIVLTDLTNAVVAYQADVSVVFLDV